LFGALWAYRIAYKVTTGHTPFQLVYGQVEILLSKLEFPSLHIALQKRLSLDDSFKTDTSNWKNWMKFINMFYKI
jgi:hypothetical protein